MLWTSWAKNSSSCDPQPGIGNELPSPFSPADTHRDTPRPVWLKLVKKPLHNKPQGSARLTLHRTRPQARGTSHRTVTPCASPSTHLAFHYQSPNLTR
mmetsp:Transcript_13563/g.21191  ORF Transcript_13563/g.21191 Transcript_13563/m.21191 type:complete len:98 (-) Transcript_13563:27-320(-)